jgi:LacI family transcriptional regulator
MKRKATLDDIAKVVNLTKVSVSKALRNHPDISEPTRLKVKEIAKSLGYRPNLIARSLTSARTKTLGVVVPKIAHNFFAHVVAGIQKYAASQGYGIVLAVSEEQEKLEKKHIETLISMQVEGLLVSVSMETKDTEIYEWLRDIQIPLVFFDRHIPGLGFNSVVIDDELASSNAVEHLIKNGFTNIAHLSGYDHISIGKSRRLGYENALNKYGLEVDPKKIVEGGFGEDAGYAGLNELLRRGIIPDAIFTVTFPVVLGAYKAMRESNPHLIEKIKILTIGADDIVALFPYPQFYVEQPAISIGEKATELLLREINGELQPCDLVEYMETRFVETGSF